MGKLVQMNVMVKPEVQAMIREAADSRKAMGGLIEKAVKFYLARIKQMEKENN